MKFFEKKLEGGSLAGTTALSGVILGIDLCEEYIPSEAYPTATVNMIRIECKTKSKIRSLQLTQIKSKSLSEGN